MDKSSFISYENYRNKLMPKTVDNKSMDEVLKEAEEITLKISQKRGE